MSLILLWFAVLLVASLLGGLVRILIGPTATDRMLAAQLLGTSGVGVLLLLAEALERPPLRDVALVFSLLAAVGAIGFVRLAADPVEGPP
ncbi:monovalent cation/H+ antiporter complex subunit F [Candidatus Laterigemmans baculatus]|uniref:monovalent cation/H+ antiporter complex subunit F n=1 Tax=Candidatus Laterigemmans baculatus TaxID=2770505 RepID=UPI0013DB264A|nr:monovalent cation/H+ antiporter complex subunit F [Candidatus Laterigemmans baculatus]